MTDGVVRTVGEMRQAMTPALQEILTAEELAATTITAVREPSEVRDRGHPFLPFEQWPRVPDEEPLDDQILLRVRTFTDSIGLWAGGRRETAAELHERFRSDLQDFVAESTFGWGQWRP